MITVKWESLRNGEFMRALGKLFATPMEFALSSRFIEIGKKIKAQQDLIRENEEKIYDRCLVKADVKGSYKGIKENMNEEFEKDMIQLNQKSVDIHVDRFIRKDIGAKIEMSPQDWMLLDCLFEQDPPTEAKH